MLLAVTPVTLAETAWVLTGPRRQADRDNVADVLLRFLARENVSCVGFDKSQAQAALLRCRAPGGADFGDALTTASLRSAAVSEIYTFDERFARAGLTPLTPTPSSAFR